MNNFKYKKYIHNDVVKPSEFITSPLVFNGIFNGVNKSQYPSMTYSGKMKDIPGLCGVRCIDYVLKYFKCNFSFEEVFKACSGIEKSNENDRLIDGIGEKTIMDVITKLGELQVLEIQIEEEKKLNLIFRPCDSILIANVTELDQETNQFGSHWIVIVDIEKDTGKILVADSSFRKEKSGGLLIYSWSDLSKIFRDLETGEYNSDETEILPPSTWYFGYAIKVTRKK